MSDHREVILVRHGESRTNASRTFQAARQSIADPLTERGEAMARGLADRLRDVPVETTISSNYLRARMTAAHLAEATGTAHLVPVRSGSEWVDLPAADPAVTGATSLLREIDVPTELDGLHFDDPRALEVQRAAAAVAEDPEGHYADEENLHDLWWRAAEIRRHLESRPERVLLVVAHGGILKVLLAHLAFAAVPGLDTAAQLAAYRGFTSLGWWDNTGVVSLRHSPETGWWWLMTDIAHLRPRYLSFLPERAEATAPDVAEEYLG